MFACSKREPFSDVLLHQFLSKVDDVEAVMRDGKSRRLRVFHHRQPWTGDDRLFYTAPQGTTLEFRGIPVASHARFSVGFGLKPDSLQPPPCELKFRVEMVTATSKTVLVDEGIKTETLAPGEIVEAEAILPEMAVETADFHFYSEGTLKPSMFQAVWCQPELRMQSGRFREERREVAFQRIRELLLDAPVEAESREGISYRCILNGVNQTNRRDEQGGALVQEVPARTVYVADLPPESGLSFSTAQFTNRLHLDGNVVFEVRVNNESLYSGTLGAQSLNRSLREYIPIPRRSWGRARIELKTYFEKDEAAAGEEKPKVQASWIYPLIEVTHRTKRLRSDEGKNLLVVVVDALRADHLSCYGYDRPTTPALDALAEKSVVFDNAYSQSSWTVPSTATLFTGQYAYTHGVYNQTHWFLIPGVMTLSDAFLQQGFTTACFSSNLLICTENNLSVGFESFFTIPYASAAQLNRAFLEWLDTRKNERFFTYLHYMDPHGLYAAPAPFIHRFTENKEKWDLPASGALRLEVRDILNRVRAGKGDPEALPGEEKAKLKALLDLYDGEVAYWDMCFQGLLDALDQRGILKNTVVVMTSDHGEEFYDHGLMEHGQSLYNELLHVPLVFYNTGLAPKRREEMVGLLDVAPTLLTLFDIPYPSMRKESCGSPAFPGFDLFRAGVATRDFLFADTFHGTRSMGGEMFIIQAAFSDRRKGILSMDTNTMELFDRVNDREERNPLDAASNTLLETEMRRRIEEWVDSCTAEAPYRISLIDAEALEKMRAMGYLK